MPLSSSDELPMITPRITSHPQDLKDAVLGELVLFTAEATGTAPLSYQWEWKPAMNDGSEWQPCDVERCAGAENSTLTIFSAQKSDEGSYHCVITNCAGKKTSKSAELNISKNPNFTFATRVVRMKYALLTCSYP